MRSGRDKRTMGNAIYTKAIRNKRQTTERRWRRDTGKMRKKRDTTET